MSVDVYVEDSRVNYSPQHAAEKSLMEIHSMDPLIKLNLFLTFPTIYIT